MLRRWLAAVTVLLAAASHGSAPHPHPATSRWNVPIRFEPNLGQAAEGVRFLGRGASYELLLRDSDASLTWNRRGSAGNVRLRWPGAARPVSIAPAKRRRGVSHYLIGPDPKRWKTNVPHYDQVLYAEAFPGIDMMFYGKERNIEFDWRVRPGADPSAIEFSWEGCDSVALDDKGDLVLKAGREEIRQHQPVAYQEIAGRRHPVPARYVLAGSRVRVAVGDYDRTSELTIDPVLSYSTYTGYSGSDFPSGIALDPDGNVYIAGSTSSTDFTVTPGAFQTQLRGGQDAGIIKISRTGDEIVYETYLGGGSVDGAWGIAVDASGSAYVAGFTLSNNFPVTDGAPQRTLGGGQDCFLTKLNPRGDGLAYSTYLGGSGTDFCNGVAIDQSGSAYVAGMTSSTNFPTVSAVQGANRGANDVFVSKLNPLGTAWVYSTYLGGTANETALGIAVDASGQAYITGNSTSSDYPTVNAFQSQLNGSQDAIVTKLSADGTSLVYSTYLGGSNVDNGNAIRVYRDGSAYITGLARSPDFPVTAGAFQTAFGGYFDAFVARLSPEGNALVFSTLLGGRFRENTFGIAVDDDGNAYVAGFTTSPDYPLVAPVQSSLRGPRDPLYVSNNSGIEWAPVGGGLDADRVAALAATPDGAQLYASTAGVGGGVFASTDGGNSWFASGLPGTGLTVTPLAVHPRNPSRILAGTTTVGLFRSDDAGATWTPTGLNSGNVAAIVFDPVDPVNVYAGVIGRGVLKSTDGGDTWNTANTGVTSTTVNALAIDPANPQVLYAGTTINVFKTIDGGRTWTGSSPSPGSPILTVAVDPRNSDTVYAGTNGRGLQKSTNGGRSWAATALRDKSVPAVVVHASRADSLFASVNGEGVYRSTNAGSTFILFTPPPSKFVHTIWIDPRRPDRVLAGATAGTDVFVAKLSADGASLLFSTYLGGAGDDIARGIALDAARNIYITGETDGDGFPVTPNAIPPLGRGVTSGFLARIGEL